MNGDYSILGVVGVLTTRTKPTLRLAWIACAVIACAMAHGEEVAPLTLSAAIAEAQEKNPEIRALSAGVAAARGEVTTGDVAKPRAFRRPRHPQHEGCGRAEYDGIPRRL